MKYLVSKLLFDIKDNYPEEAKRIASAARRIINEEELIKMADQVLDSHIDIDINELDSLTSPNKVISNPHS